MLEFLPTGILNTFYSIFLQNLFGLNKATEGPCRRPSIFAHFANVLGENLFILLHILVFHQVRLHIYFCNGSHAIPLYCIDILLIQGNLSRFFPMFTLNYASILSPISINTILLMKFEWNYSVGGLVLYPLFWVVWLAYVCPSPKCISV